MREVTAAQIKGLFYHLVKATGGVEAAGAYLGISHQRVSQLQSVKVDDLPTLTQIITLECATGQPIVTGGLARLVNGEQPDPAHVHEEICDAVEAVTDLLRSERAGDERGFEKAAIRLKREAAEIPMSLKPRLRAVD